MDPIFNWCTLGEPKDLFVIIQAISLLVAQAPEVAKFMTNLTLVIACWTPKPFSMLKVTTFWISFWSCVLRVKFPLIFLWHSWFLFIKLVGFLPRLEGSVFFCWTYWVVCLYAEATGDGLVPLVGHLQFALYVLLLP